MDKLAENVLRSAISQNAGMLVEQTFYEKFMGFIHAIRWEEIGLLCFTSIVLYCAQYINAYGNEHWRDIGFTQNYFDKYGVFISLMFSLPLLLSAAFQMLYALFTSCGLLVKVKKAELRQQQKARREAEKNPAAEPTETKKEK